VKESMHRQYAIIAGSGSGGFGGFGDGSVERAVTSRFGWPSAALRELPYGDHKAFTLARHGDAHDIAPHCINYRANLLALKQMKVDQVIASTVFARAATSRRAHKRLKYRHLGS
jgi:purine nucleoside phosphorylase